MTEATAKQSSSGVIRQVLETSQSWARDYVSVPVSKRVQERSERVIAALIERGVEVEAHPNFDGGVEVDFDSGDIEVFADGTYLVAGEDFGNRMKFDEDASVQELLRAAAV